MAARAICMVLSDRVATNNLIIRCQSQLSRGKTKALKEIIDKLLVAQESDEVKKTFPSFTNNYCR